MFPNSKIGAIRMQDEKSMFDVAFEVTGDVEESQMIEKWHNNAVDVKSQELAEKKAEKLFETKKEEFRLEVIREIDAANVRVKGAEISSSPYISKQVETNGTALTREHFVPEGNVRDPQYSGDQLMYNDGVRSWQHLKSKGGRNFISDFVVSVIVVVNATGPGQCEAIVVCL